MMDFLLEELDFNHVLIESLDPGSDEYEERLAELEEKKRDLLRQLSEVEAQNASGARVAAFPVAESSAGSSRNDLPAPNNAHESLDACGVSSTPSCPAGSNPPGSHGITSTNKAGSKRAFPGDHLTVSHERQSKRGTPDPSTPNSSESSFEVIEHPSADLAEKARRRQLQAEATLKRKRERQLADERFARSLNKQVNTPSSSSSSRPPIQTTIGRTGSFQRPPPPPKLEPTSTSSRPQQTYPQYSASSAAYNQSTRRPSQIKPEPSQLNRNLAQRPRQSVPTDVVDLTASDSEDERDAIYFAPPRHPRNVDGPSSWQQRTTPMNSYPSSSSSSNQPAYHNNNTSMPGLLVSARSTFNNVKNLASAIPGQLSELSHLIGPKAYGVYPVDDGDHSNDDDDDDDVIFSGSRGLYQGHEDAYWDRFAAYANYDPAKTKEEINSLLENIRPDEEMPEHLRVQTPEALTIRLHKYQELGLTWLQKCEEGSNKGGILADDMGLGKTIQMLSLIVAHKSEDPSCRTTLVVAPVALMRQWKQEIEQKVKPGPHRLNVFIHHGATKKKRFSDLQVFDVVLTTYGSVAAEVKRSETFKLRQKHDPNARQRPNEVCALTGDDSRWYRVILDEAQCIKNKNTQTAKGAFMLKATYRFCMTGTPMMNNVDELFSLVHFLRIKPYTSWEKFRLDFTTPLKSPHDGTKNQAMKRLQALCKAIMLRRTKRSKFEGQPILILPERINEIDNPTFDDDERMFYEALEQRTQLQFNKYLKAGTVGKSYSAILVLLLRLRQACCHPHLIRDFGVSAAADVTPEQLVELAAELSTQVVERIKERGGNFECPVCYDASTNPAIFIPCGHDTCPDCFAKISDPANAIADGNDGRQMAKCPTCRSQVDPKRITDFESFKRVHQQELLSAEELAALNADDASSTSEDDSSDSDEDSDDDSDENEKDKTLGGFIVEGDVEDSETESEQENHPEIDEAGPSVKPEVKEEAVEENQPGSTTEDESASKALVLENGKGKGRATDEDLDASQPTDKSEKKKSKKSKKDGKGKAKAKKKKPKTTKTLAEMKKLAGKNAKAKKDYLRMLRKDWVSSAKIDKTLEILTPILEDPEQEKVLIFSQWTSLLDLLEVPIDREGWGYRRYDGSMNARARGDAVDDFRDTNKNVRIMLISLKAGNAGLNLNMASQVIILDPFWNPYIEEQAIDRAHRIGQVRPVKVHRVLVEGTVEDRIVELQEKKRELISTALDEKASQSIGRLGVRELAYLFGVTSNPNQQVAYQPRNDRH
ncbi:putative helicase, Zinc finger, RING-type, Zinc finger, RING/FYVE/PHD-type [Acrodontium crateriforme]|uniref:Helicase, Zinc finger, RING-type, Zinc finger, RING/FYVE/PHD-type n=1 Tax=Acrodontium crateriforme TaxID=150365 RepID=A0AAQ3M5Y4_9PEZI|nr:putative helicase, Zinc finger, RING-type, Zinc finger, RING/FYVE/PHD-type [Acrodontium crateriforme]